MIKTTPVNSEDCYSLRPIAKIICKKNSKSTKRHPVYKPVTNSRASVSFGDTELPSTAIRITGCDAIEMDRGHTPPWMRRNLYLMLLDTMNSVWKEGKSIVRIISTNITILSRNLYQTFFWEINYIILQNLQ